MTHPAHNLRNGSVLVCVLACLAVVTALVATSVHAALRDRREARLQLQLRQTELLCEAGVMRAAQKLRSSVNYQGERWHPDLPIESYHNAVVEIKITTSPEQNSTRRVTVVAKLDSNFDSDGPMQRTHHFTFQMLASATLTETQ